MYLSVEATGGVTPLALLTPTPPGLRFNPRARRRAHGLLGREILGRIRIGARECASAPAAPARSAGVAEA
jgi:hypothetical protein